MGLEELDELRQKQEDFSSNPNTCSLLEKHQILWTEPRTRYALWCEQEGLYEKPNIGPDTIDEHILSYNLSGDHGRQRWKTKQRRE